ncbi:hypothetical protein EPH_0003860 [Eimeria praecox]|uniref:Uncharacterized protein n=1 Tax=Eimeria praecox TaxID=51316 RepID=U6G8G4_9EIME|nr:hypothetical protein EPH_0003860 [Eimeria praecox]
MLQEDAVYRQSSIFALPETGGDVFQRLLLAATNPSTALSLLEFLFDEDCLRRRLLPKWQQVYAAEYLEETIFLKIRRAHDTLSPLLRNLRRSVGGGSPQGPPSPGAPSAKTALKSDLSKPDSTRQTLRSSGDILKQQKSRKGLQTVVCVPEKEEEEEAPHGAPMGGPRGGPWGSPSRRHTTPAGWRGPKGGPRHAAEESLKRKGTCCVPFVRPQHLNLGCVSSPGDREAPVSSADTGGGGGGGGDSVKGDGGAAGEEVPKNTEATEKGAPDAATDASSKHTESPHLTATSSSRSQVHEATKPNSPEHLQQQQQQHLQQQQQQQEGATCCSNKTAPRRHLKVTGAVFVYTTVSVLLLLLLLQ